MGDWGWVTVAMVVTYASLLGYAWSLLRRTATARRRLQELE